MLVLDKWACNSDGLQAIFKHEASRSRRYTAVFIDQGFCFNAGEWNFPDAPLRDAYAWQRVYENVTAWESFEPALTRAEQLDLGELWRYAAQVPEEWYDYDVSGMNRLIEMSYRRRRRIRDLISEFRKSKTQSISELGRAVGGSMEDHLTFEEQIKQHQSAAKTAILAQCDRLDTARITFVAAHFDGSGDDGVTEEVKCYDSDVYAYEECEPVTHEASYLQEHFEALVPYGYENDAGGFGDVVLDVRKRKITVARNDRFEDYATTTYEV